MPGPGPGFAGCCAIATPIASASVTAGAATLHAENFIDVSCH
jgi:hypothetical protein